MREIDLFRFSGSDLKKGTILRWFPFSHEYKLTRIEETLKSVSDSENNGNDWKSKVCENAIKRLENMDNGHLNDSLLKKKFNLHRSACWILVDLWIDQKDFWKAKDSLDKGKKLMPPETLEEFEWIGEKYLKIGHLLLANGGKAGEAINLFEEAERYKPFLDEKANQELVKSWADKQRMDRKAMQKYFQHLKPDYWMKDRFRSVIYNGCKIDPKSENGVGDKITYNRKVSAFHENLDWPYKNLGHGYLKQGDYKKAVEYFEKAKKINSNSRDYGFWIGKASYLASDYEKSYQELSTLPQEILGIYKGEYELFYGLTLARLLFDSSGLISINMDEAASFLETAIAVVEDNHTLIQEAFFFLGIIRARQNKFNDAILFLVTATDKDPYNSRYLSALADVLNEAGQKKDAITSFKKAILYGEDNDENAALMVTTGDLFQEEGNDKEAERWYLLAKNKGDPPIVLLRFAQRHLKEDDFNEAFEKAKELQDKVDNIHHKKDEILREMQFILGRCNVRFNNFIEAEESLLSSFNLGRDSWDTYYWLGLSSAHQTKYEEAKAHLNNSLNKNAKHPNIHIQMGNIILLQGVSGNISEAIEHFRTAKELSETSSITYKDALYGLGKCYQKEGNNEEAKEHYNQLINIDPDHEGANYSLSIIYEKEGMLKKCEKRLRLIIEINNNNGNGRISPFLGPAYLKLAMILCNNEDNEKLKEAEEMLDSAIKLGHEDENILFYKGLIEIKSGRLEQGHSRWLQLYEIDHLRTKKELSETSNITYKDKINIELKENLAKANYLFGVSLFNTGKYKEAIEQFELCREVFKELDELKLPNWIAEAYFQSGLNMLKTGKVHPNANIAKQAGKLFDKAMEINPEAEEDYMLLKGICELYLGKNHLAKAAELFDQVLKHNPENDIAVFFSGLCNFLQKDDKEKQALALEKFNSLLNKEMADDNMKYMAQFIVACEEIKNGNNEAMDTLLPLLQEQELINRFPFPVIPFNSWLARHMVQHYDSESVGKVEEIYNSSDLFQYALALVHSIKGNYEKAISHFDKIYLENKKNKEIADQYANMLCYSAAQNVKKDKVKDALTDLNLAKRVLAGQ